MFYAFLHVFHFSQDVDLAPQNDSLNLTFVKDIHVVGKKKARNGRKTYN